MSSSSTPLLKDTCCPFKVFTSLRSPSLHEVFHYISAFESHFSFWFSPKMLRSFTISERSTLLKHFNEDITLF